VTAAPTPRELPSVDALAAHPGLSRWHEAPAVRARAARSVLEEERTARRGGTTRYPDGDALAAAVALRLGRLLDPGPRRVINATGTVVHTNLGRAPLSAAARAAAVRAAGYCDLEYDLGPGVRGSRQDHLAPLVAELCAAEDALVVTNNAAAVLLTMTALCRGGEVLVSRGEAVEIGGGFRIPDVMRQSGARMVDVGTTNRTRAADYATAITPRTRAIVRVHASNFSIRGFTERPTTAECATIAREHGLLLIEDAGSGALLDPPAGRPELAGEPVLASVVAAGADIVLASGDKLCGGPQAGVVAGRADPIGRMRRHPLMRALRPDKMIVAALGATLAAYLRSDAVESIPVQRMLNRSDADLAGDARAWTARLRDAGVAAEAVAAASTVGGGSAPEAALPTTCVVLPGPTGRLLAALRAADPPVVARAEGGRVWLDPRTVLTDEADTLIDCVRQAWEAVHPTPVGRPR